VVQNDKKLEIPTQNCISFYQVLLI